MLIDGGNLRVIGFESIPGTTEYHSFYQRPSPLLAITDTHNSAHDALPDSEGFCGAIEGVHILPFAMHLSVDNALGTAKGLPCPQTGATIRYIAMMWVHSSATSVSLSDLIVAP